METGGFYMEKIRIKLVFDDFAENVEWGGVTHSPPNSSNPPMGSGFFPDFPYPSRYAFCRGLVLLNDKGETI